MLSSGGDLVSPALQRGMGSHPPGESYRNHQCSGCRPKHRGRFARACRLCVDGSCLRGQPGHAAFRESRKRPLTAYGANKLGSKRHARVAGNVHGVPSTGFRFFNICGPRQDRSSPYSGVTSIFASKMEAGETSTIFGDGEQVRDFVYVGDCVRFVMAGMEQASTDAISCAVSAVIRNCLQ